KQLGLGFTLLADEKGELAKKFAIPTTKGLSIPVSGSGVPLHKLGPGGITQPWIVEKPPPEWLKLDVGIRPYTVVIDRNGKIAAKYERKERYGDVTKVLEIVKKLKE